MKSIVIRQNTAMQISEVRDLPDGETESLFDEVNVDHILRALTGLPTSKIASLGLADEWD